MAFNQLLPAGEGINCTYEISPKYAKKLADLCGIIVDLQDVIEGCNKIIELLGAGNDADKRLSNHIWSSVLIKYFRCFDPNGKRQAILKPLSDVFKNIKNGDPTWLHNHLKAIRDKHIAHSVNNHEIIKIGVTVNPYNKTVLGLTSLIIHRVYEDEKVVNDLKVLATQAIIFSQNLRQQYDNEITQKLKEDGYEEVIKKPKLRFNIDSSPEATKRPRES